MGNRRDYLTVTGAYWAFTLTDGALRMLVLLRLNELGYAPLEIVALFLLYELFGVVTNLAAGWIGARFGLKATLFLGLGLQTCALAALFGARHDLAWPVLAATQVLSGVAKDLTKTSSKSYVKLVVPEGDLRGLMRWVSLLTGSKNALKGVGFFLGGLLLATIGFGGACLALAIWVALALIVAMAVLPRAPGRVKARIPLRDLVTSDRRLRWLSAARLFLFGSRDVWFALALPVFLASGLAWSFERIGAFLAAWVIGYGAVQAAAPAWVQGRGRATPTAALLGTWTATLVLPLAAILVALRAGAPPAWTLIAGLGLFGVVFAANSAIHSYLVVAYSDREKVALNVGFYYMANAAGRFVGTLLSGVAFQTASTVTGGLAAALATSIGLVIASSLLCIPLRRAERVVEAAAAPSPEVVIPPRPTLPRTARSRRGS